MPNMHIITSMIAPHPHERPLRAAVVLVSALFWSGLLLLLWTLWNHYKPRAITLSLADIVMLAGAGAIVAYVSTWLRKAGQAAALAGHAVEIGPEQFPDLHARIEACIKRLGLGDEPHAYLFQAPRHGPSLSLRYRGRDYLAFHAELIGMLTEHQGAIDFFVGYEFGRLRDPDRGFSWLLLPGRVMPLVGPAYARAKIYTYDRYGLAACRTRVDAALALALLAAGSRRWKSFNVSQYAGQGQRTDIVFTFFELISPLPYLARRIAHLRGIATGEAASPRRHPLAWIGATLIPGIAPVAAGAVVRAAFALAWVAVLAVALWHGHRQLASAGLVEPLESRFENKVVVITPPPTIPAPLPTPTQPAPTDIYTQIDKDLRRLGDVALNRHRKLGGIPCEVGTIAALNLQFSASRYAFSCDEPVVYTVVGPGEFEAGRSAHLRSYNWKDNKFSTSLPPLPAIAPGEPPSTAPPPTSPRSLP